MLALPTLLGSECSLSLGSGELPVREIVVVPSVVELAPGGLASVEAIGRDRLGGRVDVPVRWTSADTAVATVTPGFARHTVIGGRGPGETRVVATHRPSGARDTVEVTVTASAPAADEEQIRIARQAAECGGAQSCGRPIAIRR